MYASGNFPVQLILNLKYQASWVFWVCPYFSDDSWYICWRTTFLLAQHPRAAGTVWWYAKMWICMPLPGRLCPLFSLVVLLCLYRGSLKHCNKNVSPGQQVAQTSTSALSVWSHRAYNSGVTIQNKYYFKVRKQMTCWLRKCLILLKTHNPLWTFVSWYSRDKNEAVSLPLRAERPCLSPSAQRSDFRA